MTVAARRRVALVADAGETRRGLADYLANAGFEVHPCDELTAPAAFGAFVLIGGHRESIDSLLELVRSWLELDATPRIVVVTSRPRALGELVASHGDRLRVLPAPAFGWELVDAIRAGGPGPPREP
jgi:hypothetical protein